MSIRRVFPPNYDKIKTFFKLDGSEVFSYYPDIYNPMGIELGGDLIAHEQVHLRQQEEIGVEKWWNLYFLKPVFRAAVEVEAHQAQYQTAMKLIKDRNKKAIYLSKLAESLSGIQYDKVMSYSDALRVIQEREPKRFRLG